MSFTRYDIYFSGQLLPERDPDQVRQDLARLFKMDLRKVERLFTGTAVRIKADVDQETAIKYRGAFTKAGAVIDIRVAGETAPAPDRSAPASGTRKPATNAAGSLTLLAANTGTLADCAPEVDPAPLPDISALTMTPDGTPLDESPPPPPVMIDISGLALAPSGSLADCARPRAPAPLPDISAMALTPAHSGTLEDCRQEPEAVEIPDISAISLELPDD
ncbi:MAG: hypothetical protein G8D28_06515 [gamma proteobacterium symbiont of Phacoides pectinatus]